MQTEIPGITVDIVGRRVIDKEYRGVRIFARLGYVTKEEAEARLSGELRRVDCESQLKAVRPRFADAAARYLKESAHNRSVEATAWHIRLLIPYLGTLELSQVHDASLSVSSPTELKTV